MVTYPITSFPATICPTSRTTVESLHKSNLCKSMTKPTFFLARRTGIKSSQLIPISSFHCSFLREKSKSVDSATSSPTPSSGGERFSPWKTQPQRSWLDISAPFFSSAGVCKRAITPTHPPTHTPTHTHTHTHTHTCIPTFSRSFRHFLNWLRLTTAGSDVDFRREPNRERERRRKEKALGWCCFCCAEVDTTERERERTCIRQHQLLLGRPTFSHISINVEKEEEREGAELCPVGPSLSLSSLSPRKQQQQRRRSWRLLQRVLLLSQRDPWSHA